MGELQPYDMNTGALAELDAEADAEAGFSPVPIQIKINHPGAVFDIPALPSVDTLEGVVLASKRVRVFFPRMGNEELTQELLTYTNNRPICTSANYVDGNLLDADWENAPDALKALKDKIAEGALICGNGNDCPLNAWESAKLVGRSGRGKACAELRRLCLWNPGWNVPVMVSIPSSSIKAWDEYCSSLSVANLRAHYMVTKLTLTKVSSPGRNYSTVGFKGVKTITPEMQQELLTTVNWRGEDQSLAKALVDVFKNRDLTIDDYPDSNGSGAEDVETSGLGEEDF